MKSSSGGEDEFQASLAELDVRVRSRIDELRRRLGRPLRVLHIGNIANNAYVNAKIMRRYGIEADAMVLDYYHIMGCPEWEEGVIEKLEGTQGDPDWHLTKVVDFSRPEWFLQGPVSLCAGYLNAKAAGRQSLAAYRHALIDYNLRFRGAVGGPRRWVYRIVWTAARKWPVLRYRIRTIPAVSAYLVRRATFLTLLAIWHALPQSIRGPLKARLAKNRDAPSGPASALGAAASGHGPQGPAAVAAGAVPASAALVTSENDTGAAVAATVPHAHGETSTAALAARWPVVEPPTAEDLRAYGVTSERFRQAFAYYDVVQGYAVDGIHPLLGGKADAYACYEHGTLRDIPYQPNPQGRACAHAYRNAPAVFITNTDCVASADNLGIPKARQFPIPHAFDSQRVIDFRARYRETMKPDNAPVTFIAPARHHWKHGEFVSWLKGNDVAIRAARALADQGLDCKIIFVRWGQEIGESEKLIDELGVKRYFEWIEPVPKHRLWQYYMSCNGVLDQFVIPAIGGVSFETLAFGRPLFTRIDEPVFKDFFGEAPPLLNVHTPEGLAEAMGRVIRDPSCYDDLSRAALEWTVKYHSSQRILEILLNGYDRIFEAKQRGRDGASTEKGIRAGPRRAQYA